LGWTVGDNLQIDYRWSAGSEDETRKYAAELVALAPDVIFASGSAAVGPLRRATRTVPIVFAVVPDIVAAKAPVGALGVEIVERDVGSLMRLGCRGDDVPIRYPAIRPVAGKGASAIRHLGLRDFITLLCGESANIGA
jgi:ABC transporter substrate binding protein